jgi:hypothetical protein
MARQSLENRTKINLLFKRKKTKEGKRKNAFSQEWREGAGRQIPSIATRMAVCPFIS